MLSYIKRKINRHKLKKIPTNILNKYLQIIHKGSLSPSGLITHEGTTLDWEYGLVAFKSDSKSDKEDVWLPKVLTNDEYSVLYSAWWKRQALLSL